MLNEAAEAFFFWIRERERIRVLKESGAPPPWTKDKWLGSLHFCNVHREDDRVTKELRKVVVDAHLPLNQLPYAYTLARLFNRASTLSLVLGCIHNRHNWVPVVKKHRSSGALIFHVAYVVSTCGKSMDKIDYVDSVANAVKLLDVPRYSLRAAFEELRKVDGMGSFLAGQVVADLKNDRYLTDAHDWHTWSCMGPGSKKGLEYIFQAKVNEKNYPQYLGQLQASLPEDIRAMRLHAQDLQNCLCEFSKYWRHINGMKGRTRNYNVLH
jgi:hypothetical protein